MIYLVVQIKKKEFSMSSQNLSCFCPVKFRMLNFVFYSFICEYHPEKGSRNLSNSTIKKSTKTAYFAW